MSNRDGQTDRESVQEQQINRTAPIPKQPFTAHKYGSTLLVRFWWTAALILFTRYESVGSQITCLGETDSKISLDRFSGRLVRFSMSKLRRSFPLRNHFVSSVCAGRSDPQIISLHSCLIGGP